MTMNIFKTIVSIAIIKKAYEIPYNIKRMNSLSDEEKDALSDAKADRTSQV